MFSDGARAFRRFTHRGAAFRICCNRYGAAIHEIVRQRRLLERYILGHRDFLTSLVPVPVGGDAPDVARIMAEAASRAGVGPMASVAGAMARLAGEAALAAGAQEAVIDNGGDLYIRVSAPLVIGIGTGETAVGDRLAFRIRPEDTPLGIGSSSGRMGHSLSLGDCDLATVVASDAALADAAATLAGNLVRRPSDIPRALARVMRVRGVGGVLLVKGDRVGIMGRLPELVPWAVNGGQGVTPDGWVRG